MTEKITVVNLTGHPITNKGGEEIIPSGKSIRLDEERKITDETVTFNGVEGLRWSEDTNDWDGPISLISSRPYGLPIVEKSWSCSENQLPPQQDNVYYVVSALVANAYPHRRDLLCPETKKDEKGSIYATALVRRSRSKSDWEETNKVSKDYFNMMFPATLEELSWGLRDHFIEKGFPGDAAHRIVDEMVEYFANKNETIKNSAFYHSYLEGKEE